MEKKIIEVDVNSIVLNVYNKIAIWNNIDYMNNTQKGDNLKIVSQDIVEEILKTVSEHMNLNSKMEIKRGDVEITQAKEEIKDFTKSDGKDIFNGIFINNKKD